MERSAEAVWKDCLDIVRDNISRQSFKTWFEPLKPIDLVEGNDQVKLVVELPSRFYYEWLEEHYFGLLRKTITKVLGAEGRLFYNIVMLQDDAEAGQEGASVQLPARPAEGAAAAAPPRDMPQDASRTGPAPPATPDGSAGPPVFRSPRVPAPSAGGALPANPHVIPGIKKAPIESFLNSTYVFDRFIEGDCNRLARSASLAIGKEPGATSFNPFLIYGGVGLGKTHLIQAIGNHALANRKAETVLYVSSEQFTTEFVQSIQHNRASEFSLFYRQIDLLIVDDVQFFGGKEKTQEEFFHIFNALHQSGKQIVLSADRPPRDIDGIEERLLSRFGWGLAADVQPPELETRIAILNRKAEDEGITIAHDLIEFIAHHIKSNIRDLEGALIRLVAYAALSGRELDLAVAREVLRDLIKDTRVSLTIEEIQRIVCEYFGVEEDLVRAKTRKREVVQARQVAMFFSKAFTQHSLKTIGLHFGGRDHSTVIHANQSVQNQIETNPSFRDTVEEIRRKIELRSR